MNDEIDLTRGQRACNHCGCGLMVRPMIIRFIAVLSLLAPVQALAGYFTYAQWAALPPQQRAMYVAGSFDALASYASDSSAGRVTEHYHQCIQQAGMTTMQLADNIIQFVSTRPELQTSTPQFAMINYLIATCGKIP